MNSVFQLQHSITTGCATLTVLDHSEAIEIEEIYGVDGYETFVLSHDLPDGSVSAHVFAKDYESAKDMASKVLPENTAIL